MAEFEKPQMDTDAPRLIKANPIFHADLEYNTIRNPLSVSTRVYPWLKSERPAKDVV
jgi:hypothetical protein